jgi:hypothetical protein
MGAVGSPARRFHSVDPKWPIWEPALEQPWKCAGCRFKCYAWQCTPLVLNYYANSATTCCRRKQRKPMLINDDCVEPRFNPLYFESTRRGLTPRHIRLRASSTSIDASCRALKRALVRNCFLNAVDLGAFVRVDRG